MPTIRGKITALVGDSAARVYVAATSVYPHDDGLITDEPRRVNITNGVVSFDAPEGLGVLILKIPKHGEKTLPISIKEGYTLADALTAGEVESLTAPRFDELVQRVVELLPVVEQPPVDNDGRDDREVSLEQEIEYFHAALVQLFASSDVIIVPPNPNRGYLDDAVRARGLDSSILEALPFDIDTRMCVDMSGLFEDWRSLKELGGINTYSATRFSFMFSGCKSLERIGVIGLASTSSSVFDFRSMFYGCESLKDGEVMIFCNPEAARNSDTTGMIDGSGLTRKPFYTPMGEPIDVP